MSTDLRNTPVQARSATRLAQLDEATKQAIAEVGRDRVTTAMIADLAGASIGTVYRYGPDRIFWLNRVQPVATHGIDRVLELHQRGPTTYVPAPGLVPTDDDAIEDGCTYCREPWPCTTIAFLTEEAQA